MCLSLTCTAAFISPRSVLLGRVLLHEAMELQMCSYLGPVFKRQKRQKEIRGAASEFSLAQHVSPCAALRQQCRCLTKEIQYLCTTSESLPGENALSEVFCLCCTFAGRWSEVNRPHTGHWNDNSRSCTVLTMRCTVVKHCRATVCFSFHYLHYIIVHYDTSWWYVQWVHYIVKPCYFGNICFIRFVWKTMLWFISI